VIYEPLYALLEAPFLYRDRDHIKKVMASPSWRSWAEPLEEGDPIHGFYENGFRNITNSKRAIPRARRREGLKIARREPAQIETFKALGAVATPMAFQRAVRTPWRRRGGRPGEPPAEHLEREVLRGPEAPAITGHIYNSVLYPDLGQILVRSVGGSPQGLAESTQEASAFQLDMWRIWTSSSWRT